MTPVQVRLSGTNIIRAADHNQRTILQAILVHKTITRIALARMTGLTPPAVANIVKRLLDEKLIEEEGLLRQGRGQPGKLLQINPHGRFSIGVNIDRDHISLLLVNFLGEIVASRSLDLPFALPADVRAYWQAEVEAMVRDAGADVSRLIGIGIAMPDDLGAIYLPGAPEDYRAWQDTDVPALFATPFDLPTFVENDAAAAALGELRFGLGPKVSSALYILISSGLGGGLLVDGHSMRGATGRSGEIGLIPLADGKRVQDYVSLSALKAHLGQSGHTLDELEGAAEDSAVMRAYDVWLAGAVERLTSPLVAVNCLLNPACILIGARLPHACVHRLTRALEQALDAVTPTLPSRAPIMRALLSDNAPAIGAAILPFHHFLLPNTEALWKEEEA
ncbi:ROK family transcriptional regulator [Sphingomonas hengshuiensis]|uniref:Sugar kinase n=1 Tax=Sphingomonas hengshuiensis TaxID=1609977 RepID=A0A7U5BFA1_9SPHN|nr:ROK family transcriptional regulator [Sphingomonas hengshuiensis]AJP74180.1 hypothetical protein TS85_01400 [Sphingomonas hengshuiensis]